jgi:hypothetical protein
MPLGKTAHGCLLGSWPFLPIYVKSLASETLLRSRQSPTSWRLRLTNMMAESALRRVKLE